MAQIMLHLDDDLLVRLKRRAWAQGMPFEDSIHLLLVQAGKQELEALPQLRRQRHIGSRKSEPSHLERA